MDRIPSFVLGRTMSQSIQRTQQQINLSEMQVASGKQVTRVGDLGSDALRILSSHRLIASYDAASKVATRLGSTLAIYDKQISTVEDLGTSLQKSITDAIGQGANAAAGLQATIQSTFDRLRTALNTAMGGEALFGGSQTAAPFAPQALADTLTMTNAQAFMNDDLKASARIGDGLDLSYGVTASDLGGGLLDAFRTLAGAGAIGNTPTPSQLSALKTAAAQIGTALDGVRALNARNGENQAAAESAIARAQDQSKLLTGIVSDAEDADLGQVATRLANQKSLLETSYAIFGQLSSLNLASYLR